MRRGLGDLDLSQLTDKKPRFREVTCWRSHSTWGAKLSTTQLPFLYSVSHLINWSPYWVFSMTCQILAEQWANKMRFLSQVTSSLVGEDSLWERKLQYSGVSCWVEVSYAAWTPGGGRKSEPLWETLQGRFLTLSRVSLHNYHKGGTEH